MLLWDLGQLGVHAILYNVSPAPILPANTPPQSLQIDIDSTFNREPEEFVKKYTTDTTKEREAKSQLFRQPAELQRESGQ